MGVGGWLDSNRDRTKPGTGAAAAVGRFPHVAQSTRTWGSVKTIVLLDSTCNSDQGAKEMMNEFVKNLLSVFSLLECSASLSASTKVMSGSLSPVTKGMMMADHLADHLAGHVHEVKVAATELLPSCWNDIRQGLFL